MVWIEKGISCGMMEHMKTEALQELAKRFSPKVVLRLKRYSSDVLSL